MIIYRLYKIGMLDYKPILLKYYLLLVFKYLPTEKTHWKKGDKTDLTRIL